MKLENRTAYDTRELRRIIVAVHGSMARTEGRLKIWEHLRILAQHGRRRVWTGAVSGRATLDGYRMWLFLPKPENAKVVDGNEVRPAVQVEAHRVAWLVGHELHHSYGFRHGHFAETPAKEWANLVGTNPVPLKGEPKKESLGSLTEVRERRAKEMLATWERRLRSAQGKVRTYRRKVRYYAKRQEGRVAAGSQPNA